MHVCKSADDALQRSVDNLQVRLAVDACTHWPADDVQYKLTKSGQVGTGGNWQENSEQSVNELIKYLSPAYCLQSAY